MQQDLEQPPQLVAAPPPPPPNFLLSKSNWQDWFLHVYPVRAELTWQDYGWVQQSGKGFLAAAALKKPVVLWLGVGHPLGAASPSGRQLRTAWQSAAVTNAMAALSPVADDLRRLNIAQDPEAKFVRALLAQAEDAQALAQGAVLVASPSGKLLAACSEQADAATLADTLQQGLEAWKVLDPATRSQLDPAQVAAVGRAEDLFPLDGLALEIFERDLPSATAGAAPDAPRQEEWSRDYLWFSRAEMERMLPGSGARLNRGKSIPENLARRIARFAFHDHLYGAGTVYQEEEVQSVTISLMPQASTPTHFHYRISGEATLQHGEGDAAYGIHVKLLGRAQWDKKDGSFSLLEIIGEGIRAGEEPGSGRQALKEGEGAPHLGIALRLVKSIDGWHQVPPAAFDQYPAGWPVGTDETSD